MKQVNEKERERIKERKNKYEEGVVLKTKMESRERHMKNVLKKKVNDLR